MMEQTKNDGGINGAGTNSNVDVNLEIPKKYKAQDEELKIISLWNKLGVFDFDKSSNKPLYSIDTPPPYASAGHLHIGHAMSYSHAEFIARYRRMAGFNVFYPMGFDDNGLPTERYVEKKYNVNKKNITRDEFIKLCLKETEEVRKIFKELWQRLGLSIDWSQTYSTINPHCQKTSQKSFLDLYNKNLMNHVDAPTTWCPKCMTAVAQADFENIDINSKFNDIKFKSSDGDDLIIATTRPELLPSCVALFAHPDDPRYQHLKDKTAKVPLFDIDVPILFDKVVEKDKGTGLMMVCTFGDKEDVDKWQRHNLPLRICITEDGRLNNLAGKFEGLKIKKAREEIISELKNNDLLISQEDISHAVNVHERCSTEIEFVKKKQWYINVIDKKQELLDIANKIKWNPSFMKVRYVDWVENLNWNWNISRQRFYGVPFPVWYCKKCGSVKLPEVSDLPVDPLNESPKTPCSCGSNEFIPEEDVMDTWMTSSVTPQINYNWGDKDNEMSNMFPMDLRPQAHDIIRTWAFYTIVKSLYHNNSIPWKEIAISGHGQDPKGQKMSKSKGNVVWVDDVFKKYSADALRFWAAGSGLGVDCPYQEKDVMNGNKLVTKMWNASKFTDYLINDNFDKNKVPELLPFDRWMLNKLNDLILKCTDYFNNNEFEKVKYFADRFFWDILCDNYLEIVKDRLYKPEVYGEDAKRSGEYVLYHSVTTLVKIFHPITPFITESVWQYFFKKYEEVDSVSISSWPKPFEVEVTDIEEKAGQLALDIISVVRKFKSDNKKSLNSEIDLKIFCDDLIKEQVEIVKTDIKATVKAKDISFVDKSSIRGDVEMGEPESSNKEIEANEEAVPAEISFFTLDVDFVEKED